MTKIFEHQGIDLQDQETLSPHELELTIKALSDFKEGLVDAPMIGAQRLRRHSTMDDDDDDDSRRETQFYDVDTEGKTSTGLVGHPSLPSDEEFERLSLSTEKLSRSGEAAVGTSIELVGATPRQTAESAARDDAAKNISVFRRQLGYTSVFR